MRWKVSLCASICTITVGFLGWVACRTHTESRKAREEGRMPLTREELAESDEPARSEQQFPATIGPGPIRAPSRSTEEEATAKRLRKSQREAAFVGTLPTSAELSLPELQTTSRRVAVRPMIQNEFATTTRVLREFRELVDEVAAGPMEEVPGTGECSQWRSRSGTGHDLQMIACRRRPGAPEFQFTLEAKTAMSGEARLRVVLAQGTMGLRSDPLRYATFALYLDRLPALMRSAPPEEWHVEVRIDDARRWLAIHRYQSGTSETKHRLLARLEMEEAWRQGGRARLLGRMDLVKPDPRGRWQLGEDGQLEVGGASIAWSSQQQLLARIQTCPTRRSEQCIRIHHCSTPSEAVVHTISEGSDLRSVPPTCREQAAELLALPHIEESLLEAVAQR